ncbi:hypothetical protein [Spiroplasma endosymbiont of Seladonia tumulorum]|uniref:hypothetical protein n=1 Tax=Spiroplasma endosymbiont of Seladonia tumulorum TaxID=3066321 RepID=UPI0030D0A77A
MKKLLSLLSVLTISGISVPTTIASTPYHNKIYIQNEINTIEHKLFLLNYDIRKKEIEFSDAKEYYEKYSKLYAETYDTGYLRYSDVYREQMRFFRKHLNNMENTKTFYFERINYLNQQK